jgi:hypothetical protein
LADEVAVIFGADTGGFVAGVDEVKKKIEGLRTPFDALTDSMGRTLDHSADGIGHTVECVNQFTQDLETLGIDGFAALSP